MRPKYGMVIDASQCVNCKSCIIACQLENNVPPGFNRAWIKEYSQDHGIKPHFQPGNCMQCDRPTCVDACPVGATYKNKDGRVIIDSAKCIACGFCIPACPYNARFIHPVSKVADKCDFCGTRLEQGLEPACVVVCPTGARVFGDLNDKSSEISRLIRKGDLVRVINAQVDTKPNIFYLNNTTPIDWPRKPKFPEPEEIKEVLGM
jgi:Fe-S-cluster-containing dehydrogenase component